MPTLLTRDVPFAKVTVGSDKGEDKSCRIHLLSVMWSDAPVSMIQVLGAQKVKHSVELPNCAKIVADEDSMIFVA